MRPIAIVIALINTVQLVLVLRDPGSMSFYGGLTYVILTGVWNYSVAAALYVGYGLWMRRLRERRDRDAAD
jgi:hypothetical protein